MRTTNVVTVLKRMGHKMAMVDCPTRWDSTHNMLARLWELRTFCDDRSPTVNELHLSDSEWQAISNLVGVLKLAKITTKCVQTEQLTAGDF